MLFNSISKSLLILSFSILSTFSVIKVKYAEAIPLTSAEKNLEMLAETALANHAMITQAFGLSNDPLNFSGNFNESGWFLNMNGNYSNMPVDIVFTGIFDEIDDTGTYNSTGTIGISSWESSGSYTFGETVDSITTSISDSIAIVRIIDIILSFDFHFREVVYPDNTSLGFYTITFKDEPILEFQDLDYQDVKIPRQPGEPEPCSLESTLTQLSFLTLNSDNGNCDAGNVSGFVVATVPEKNSILPLLILGNFGLILAFKRKVSAR